MLLAKPNPQNYYSVTVALFRPNLLIELKRFLFISFSFFLFFFVLVSFHCFSLFLSFLFSLSFYFLVFLLFPFVCSVAQPLSRHVRTKAGFVLLFGLNEKTVCVLPLLSTYFYVGAISFLYAQRCSRRVCVVLLIYNNVGC